MALCHGQGDPRVDTQDGGCCHIAGVGVCPMRWFVDATGDVYDSDRNLVDTLDEAIRTTFGVNNPNTRDDIVEFLGWQTGVEMFICTAAGRSAVDHWVEFMSVQGQTLTMTDRAQFDVRWGEEFDVGGSAEAIGDIWAAAGQPRNWCVTYGPTEGHCCHREDQATNDARRANLSTTAVNVRSQAQGAN